MSRATSIEDPFFYVDAVHGKEHKHAEEPGVQIMSVDILPSELPMESSQHFSDSLYPFIKELVRIHTPLVPLKITCLAKRDINSLAFLLNRSTITILTLSLLEPPLPSTDLSSLLTRT